ncbi:MAG: cysteine hydrolase [Azonexus sp.]|uniref:cysteine hydrolase n=1 Tax=Azonexus sp. TaxID=1872668 RepID=UPI00281FB03F|nr:cysteine hydrolase [Azonexus sp.]MDR0777299.1 cysteine hydrolase [Azonexus sp.]
MATQNIHLVIIDPQNDFCDLPESERPVLGGVPQAPALPVIGADADMRRVARLIREGGAGLSNISITLDSHQHVDIAHPTFWRQGDGEAVVPFTPIRANDVRAGRYLPRPADALPRVIAYLEQLEANGRYVHMVWPVHCEIGTWGGNVHDAVRRAYNAWEEARCGIVNKVVKGVNPWTEHYSAIQAEVPDPADPATQLNEAFMAQLRAADRVLIAGEAGSHCVKATTEHIVENYDAGSLDKLILLTNCMSPVAGFEAQYCGFVEDMRRRGVQIAQSSDVLPLLLANR